MHAQDKGEPGRRGGVCSKPSFHTGGGGGGGGGRAQFLATLAISLCHLTVYLRASFHLGKGQKKKHCL